ncbi:FtsH protease activity modulator HflK [Clostridium formicaceticum]|uniref:Protein HflK n=1 Tax=Clostridium formicaceticum TaxID=1497 RepID=A0AAC9RH92_9CLOT|nr:FtsH protease activity modulator HflK [Clostridium formicaceticum]AOY76545.1 HflK protein [Clostridium formicaceticum]ARE86961.1 Modulator of FtsH protease HflK [Clostridium formicaceticum]
MKTKTKVILYVILGGILVLNCWYMVKTGEKALVVRFGENIKVETTTGIKFKMPFIDRIIKYNTEELHQLEYGFISHQEENRGNDESIKLQYTDNEAESLLLTKGSYIVNGELILQYKIGNVYDYHYKVSDQIGTLQLALESVIRRNVQNKTLDDALLNKEVISAEILPEIRKKVNEYGLGIEVVNVEIQNISVPSEVKAAYDDVNNAKNEKSGRLEEANKYKNSIIPEARAEAYKLVEEAKGYKSEKLGQAKGDVASFLQVYEQYKAAPSGTKKRLYLETMEKVLQKAKNKYIVDIQDGAIKYIPLGN